MLLRLFLPRLVCRRRALSRVLSLQMRELIHCSRPRFPEFIMLLPGKSPGCWLLVVFLFHFTHDDFGDLCLIDGICSGKVPLDVGLDSVESSVPN